ncbi:HEPN domain-containing protein [Arthrobacter sp. RAF14]|uniref:HEPN domain-containing protein n=1 Tax=Arthrobacter sp. RAF14 TaxID=3233051 RepID=UPI003F93A625
MTAEKPPLELLVEPDEYLCTWLLPGVSGVASEHPGSLELRADHHPTGVVYGNIPIQWEENPDGHRSAGFPQVVPLDRLRARLANGHEVDLIDATVTYWSPGQGHITASTAIVGLASGVLGFSTKFEVVAQDEEQPGARPAVPTYSQVSAQVGALDAIMGAPPFASIQFPNPGELRRLEGDWTVTGNPDSSKEWHDEDVTVRFEYGARVAVGNHYAFRFVVSPVLRIEAKEPMSVREWVDQWVDPLRRISSIATGSAQPLTYLAVHALETDGTGTPRKRQIYGSGITQAPYQSDQTAVRNCSSAIFIADDDLSLLDMLRRWQRLEQDHHPLIETYGAMLSVTTEHPRSRFLLLLQALEGLHGYETAKAYEERKGRHTEKREAIIAALKESGTLNSNQRTFVKDNLSKHPPRGLRDALRDLIGELPLDFTPNLKSCKLLADYLDEAQGSDIHRVAEALSRVRNDLAHGNRGYDAYDLYHTVSILERMVRAHALRLLGCPDTVLKRVCNPGL